MNMEAEEGPKGRAVRTIEVDFDNPEQTFLFPNIHKLRSWYRRAKTDVLDLMLEFRPGFYILSELSFDDSDLGVFKIEYIDRLIELDRRKRQIDWAAPAAVINRRSLRPLPDAILGSLAGHGKRIEYDFRAMADSFLAFLSEQSSLTILKNESFSLYSSFGESEEEFRQACHDHANAEKSETALELGAVFERKLQQAVTRLDVPSPSSKEQDEQVVRARVEDLRLACKSLIIRAINLHVLEPHLALLDRPSTESYIELLQAEAGRLAGGLEGFGEAFSQFSAELIDKFGAIEREVNAKADDIVGVDVPLARCTIQLLRVAQVWLPYWQADYRKGGRAKTSLLKGY